MTELQGDYSEPFMAVSSRRPTQICNEAMEEFFQWAVGCPYLFTLDELCLAEAWANCLQIDQRKKAIKPDLRYDSYAKIIGPLKVLRKYMFVFTQFLFHVKDIDFVL